MVNTIDRDAVLNMWADPARISTRKIAAHFKAANGTVCWIIIRARDLGDPRAKRRAYKWMIAKGWAND
jgi:hypothetical protein